MMKQFLIVSFLLTIFINIYSQSRDSLLKIYNNEAIYRLGTKYIKGNEQLTFSLLQSEFTSDITKGLYRQSKKN